MADISYLALLYEDFQLLQVIDPDKFDKNFLDIKNKINEAILVLNTDVTSLGSHKISSDHDSRYYTKTLLDSGQLDNRYYTEAEININTANLQNQINADVLALTTHKTSSDHDGRYYTETEVDAKDAVLTSALNTHKTSTDHDTRYYTKTQVDGTTTGIQDQVDADHAEFIQHKTSADHDGRYYTEVEVDAKDAVIQAQITALQSSSEDLEVINARGGEVNLDTRLDKIDNKMVDYAPISLSLTAPTVITRTAVEPQSPEINFTPTHIVNLLGRDGNCEDASKWTIFQTTLALDTTKKVFGTNAIKITLTSTVGTAFKLLSTTTLDVTKYYLFSAYLDKGNATSISLTKDATGGGVQRSVTSTATTPTRSVFKTQPSDLAIGNIISAVLNGASGQYAFVDGIQVNEITATEYSTLTDAQLLAKYPYVDSIGTTINPSAKITHADGSIAQAVVEGEFLTGDLVNIIDNQVTGSKLWKKRVLFGKDYDWSFAENQTTYFNILLTGKFTDRINNGSFSSQLIHIKHDGKILNTTLQSGADYSFFNTTGLSLGVANTDSGWVGGVSPNNDEVKAYMTGWKATANNGTRYTQWISVVDGTTAPTVQSIDFVKANLAPNYEGYKLYYKLATPQPINEGSDSYLATLVGDVLMLESGANSVVFDTGVVKGEVVNPVTDGTNYAINIKNGVQSASILKNQAQVISTIYKNGVDNTSAWTKISNSNVYGVEFAYIPNANFDPSAVYTVDYTPLRTVAPSISTAQLKYADGLVQAIEGLYGIVDTKQNQSEVLDILTDSSIYEKVTAMWQAPSIYHSSGVMYLVINVPILRKIAKPIITLTDWRINVGGGASAFTDIKTSGLSKVGSVTATSLAEVSIRFDITDATTITNIKTNGVQCGASFIADCRGVI